MKKQRGQGVFAVTNSQLKYYNIVIRNDEISEKNTDFVLIMVKTNYLYFGQQTSYISTIMKHINIFCLNYNKFEIYTIKTEHNIACTIITFPKIKNNAGQVFTTNTYF